MAPRDKENQIDARWRELQPGWDPKEHDAERKILHDLLQDAEGIEALVGCVWGPENVFRPNAGRLDRMRQYDGIAVVTGRRVVFVKRSGMNKLSTEMSLHNIESVDVGGDGEVTLTGRSYSNWVGHGDPAAFKMRDVQAGYARHFADRVQQVQASPPAPSTPAWSSASPGAPVAPLSAANYGGMSKADRIDAQWRERSTMWGRNNPSMPERLIAGLLSNFNGENITTYPGELRILQDVMEDDENIEYWMGGRWGDAEEFNTLAESVGRLAMRAAVGAATGMGGGMGAHLHEFGVHNGVVVATDRRILLLNSGMVSKDVVEVPYEGLQLDYNEGMICSGLKFSGSTDEDYAYYLDHNGKSHIKGRARPLFECVQRRAAAADLA